jgi:hypothetical protein
MAADVGGDDSPFSEELSGETARETLVGEKTFITGEAPGDDTFDEGELVLRTNTGKKLRDFKRFILEPLTSGDTDSCD